MSFLRYFLFCMFFIVFSLFAQTKKNNSTNKSKSEQKISKPMVLGTKISIKDGSIILLDIENEGTAG